MKMKDQYLPCLVNQVIKVADITQAPDREALYRKIFTFLAQLDFQKTNPEVIGETFAILKTHLKNDDPYYEVRKYYNMLLMDMSESIEEHIRSHEYPFYQAVKYAVIGNIIDFNPIYNRTMDEIMKFINDAEHLDFTINHVEALQKDIQEAKTLLYLGDNCGEICLDKLLIKQIKKENPNLKVYFGVRGAAVVNDSIEADAYDVGIDEYATIISNGDYALGTVLERTSETFRKVFESADVVIAKGQANYECLSEYEKKKIYFLLMVKCQVIANDIGVATNSLVCLNKNM